MIPSNKINLLRNGVNVIGCFKGQFGLAETARLFVVALQKQGIPHSLISADFLVPNYSKMQEHDFVFEEKGKYAVNLFCTNDEAIEVFIDRMGIQHVKNHYNISTCFWETNNLPKERLKKLNLLDEVWVTSHYIHETISSKTDVPVYHIPQPIQLNYTQGTPNKAAFGFDEKFTFLFCFDFNSIFDRKNPKALVKAFQKAFPEQNHVQLVIKSQHGHLRKHQLDQALKLIKDDPRIKWIDETMDQKKRYDLMNACDCYVSLHRSEGLGLTMAEAMLLEKPVIATGYSGNLDFMTKENSFLCGYKLVPVGPGNDPYPPEDIWADVDIEEAAHWMNYVIKHNEEAKVIASRGKEDILRHHLPEAVGKKIAERLQLAFTSSNLQGNAIHISKLYINYLSTFYKSYFYHVILRYPRAIFRRLKKLFKIIINKFQRQYD